MNQKEILSEIGLTERESKVYLALLELGSTTTGPLVKKSGVPNSKIYEILESLQNKGLVSWIIKGKTKYFQASDPKKILSIFKEKEREIENLIPLLEFKQKKEKQSVELFEGIKSIFAFLTDLIDASKKGETYYSFSFGKEHENEQVEIFYKKIGIKRQEKGLSIRILANKEAEDAFKKAYADRIASLKKIVRITDFNFPQGIIVFRDNIIILNWEETPTAIHIQNKKLSDQYTKFFEDLWKQAKQMK